MKGSHASPVPVLRTDRFTLRPLAHEDTRALFPTFSDPAQCRYLLQGAFEDEAALDAWLFDMDWPGRTWIAVDQEGDVAARLVAVERSEQVCDIGYITTTGWQRRGVAVECAAVLVDHLIRAEGYLRIAADTDPRNVGSNAVLERLGFRREGHLRRSVRTHIGWCDELLWGLLAEEWQGL